MSYGYKSKLSQTELITLSPSITIPPKDYAACMGYFRRIGGMTALRFPIKQSGDFHGKKSLVCLCAGEEWPDKKLKQLEDSAIPGRALCLPNLGVFV
jgi:hypothetical protein